MQPELHASAQHDHVGAVLNDLLHIARQDPGHMQSPRLPPVPFPASPGPELDVFAGAKRLHLGLAPNNVEDPGRTRSLLITHVPTVYRSQRRWRGRYLERRWLHSLGAQTSDHFRRYLQTPPVAAQLRSGHLDLAAVSAPGAKVKCPLRPLIDYVLQIDARSVPYRTEGKSLLATGWGNRHGHVEIGGVGDREAMHETGSAQDRVHDEDGDHDNHAG